MKTKVITHRGLDPDLPRYFPESSFEAFTGQLARGYGLEFDVRVTRDSKLVAIHDAGLERLTKGRDTRKISDVDLAEILDMDFDGSHLVSIPGLLELIQREGAKDSLSALHLKAANQTPEILALILEALKAIDPKKLIIFDPTITSANFIHNANPDLQLAASVSHPYDIERFNSAAGGTLITMEQLLENPVYTWAWLDEWDLRDRNGGRKSLLNQDTFNRLHQNKIGIALVTPELHATSPAQPTGVHPDQLHEDAATRQHLNECLAEIVDLEPDAMCTDHPDFVRNLISGHL